MLAGIKPGPALTQRVIMNKTIDNLEQENAQLKAELSRAVNLLDEVVNYTGDYNSALEDDWVMSRIHQVLAKEDKA